MLDFESQASLDIRHIYSHVTAVMMTWNGIVEVFLEVRLGKRIQACHRAFSYVKRMVADVCNWLCPGEGHRVFDGLRTSSSRLSL